MERICGLHLHLLLGCLGGVGIQRKAGQRQRGDLLATAGVHGLGLLTTPDRHVPPCIDPVVLQSLGCGGPVVGVPLQQGQDKALALLTLHLEEGANAEIDNAPLRPPKHGCNVRTVKGQLAGQDEEEKRARAETVDLGPVRLAVENFWSRIARRAAPPGHLLRVSEVAGDAKVREHGPAVHGQQHVLRLHVPVHNATPVDVRQGRQQRADHIPRAGLSEGALQGGIEKVTAGTALHGQDPAAVAVLDINIVPEEAMVAHDVRVPLHCGQHLHFLPDVIWQ
mmetsp:Transcript_67472/g.187015  ORF Transcript_67472/g.187015 Transcript_67472/m.187015 type:complete len:280 (+) Transcript_67472:1037-1876(+)